MSRKTFQRLGHVVLLGVAALTMIVGPAPFSARASSHREAPLIAFDPQADNTDVYAFVSPDRPDTVTLVGNWIPFESPSGGPNFYRFADEVDYELHVDNVGDARSYITYRFNFTTVTRNPNTFLYNTGPIDSLSDPDWNVYQVYTVTEIITHAGVLTTNVLGTGLLTPPVNIGSKSTPNYNQLADGAICLIEVEAVAGSATGQACGFADTLPTPESNDLLVFAGQRDDPFFVDLQVFDLLTLRGQAPPVGYGDGPNKAVDSVSGYATHSIVLQIPISRLNGSNSLIGNNPETVIGVWATSSRPSTRVLSPLGGVAHSGDMVQISRLGMPLVNEVVVPLALKDAFNGLLPEQDLGLFTSGTPTGDLFAQSVLTPELQTLLGALYGVPNPGKPRTDIFDIFLQGMVTAQPFTIKTRGGLVVLPPGTNVNRPAAIQPAEMLRLNTAMPFRPGVPGSLCAPKPSRLGVLGGDACGFPNGRRLADDVTDIELLAVGGAAWQLLTNDTSFTFNPDLSSVLIDRVDQNDSKFRETFPYLALPGSGQLFRTGLVGH